MRITKERLESELRAPICLNIPDYFKYNKENDNKYSKKKHGFWEYKQVNLPLGYSGGIILCADLVGHDDWFSDYECTHHFRDVLELRFEDGIVKSSIDHSETMEEIRGFTELSFLEQKELVADYFSLYSNKWINYYKL